MEENNWNQNPDHAADSSKEASQEEHSVPQQDNTPQEGIPAQDQDPKPLSPQNNPEKPCYAPWQDSLRNNGQTPLNSNYHYQNQPAPQMPKKPTEPMTVTGLMLGIFSLLLSCCCFPVGFIVGFACAMIGLVLSILSKKGKPFSAVAVAGLAASILGICESLFFFFCYLLTAQMMKDPELAPLINEFIEQFNNSIFPQMIHSSAAFFRSHS